MHHKIEIGRNDHKWFAAVLSNGASPLDEAHWAIEQDTRRAAEHEALEGLLKQLEQVVPDAEAKSLLPRLTDLPLPAALDAIASAPLADDLANETFTLNGEHFPLLNLIERLWPAEVLPDTRRERISL